MGLDNRLEDQCMRDVNGFALGSVGQRGPLEILKSGRDAG